MVAGAFAFSTFRATGVKLEETLLGLPRVALIGVNALVLRLPVYELRRLAQGEPSLVALAVAIAVGGAITVGVVLWHRLGRERLVRSAAVSLAGFAPLARSSRRPMLAIARAAPLFT